MTFIEWKKNIVVVGHEFDFDLLIGIKQHWKQYRKSQCAG